MTYDDVTTEDVKYRKVEEDGWTGDKTYTVTLDGDFVGQVRSLVPHPHRNMTKQWLAWDSENRTSLHDTREKAVLRLMQAQFKRARRG